MEKNQTDGTNVTLHPHRQAIWGPIWKYKSKSCLQMVGPLIKLSEGEEHRGEWWLNDDWTAQWKEGWKRGEEKRGEEMQGEARISEERRGEERRCEARWGQQLKPFPSVCTRDRDSLQCGLSGGRYLTSRHLQREWARGGHTGLSLRPSSSSCLSFNSC